MDNLVDLNNVEFETVTVVEKEECELDAMDIEVENTHYYTLSNNIVSHNSVSILTQTTSGIEPCYKMSYKRRKKITDGENGRVDHVDETGDKWQEFEVYHPKVKTWMKITGETDIEKSPWYGACAEEINWENRVKIQAIANKNIDHSISSTTNLPSTATVEEVDKIYRSAWKSGCKGITVYRDGSRSGVLIDNNKSKFSHIPKTDSPKRPDKLNCEVFYPTVSGKKYFVIIGLLNEKEPYEIFAGEKENFPTNLKQAIVKKIKRGKYILCDIKDENNILHDNISEYISDEEEAITRLISSNLRHGCSIEFIVHQLEKTKGDLMGFTKAVSRILKKYIEDGKTVSGEECPECGAKLHRQEGCVSCTSCPWTKCG